MISIIITYYNVGNKTGYIEQVLKSLERQTCQDYEVIIIDNNSPIHLEIKETDKIKIIHLDKNLGNCKTRNIGIDIARGERITWNDSDWLYCKDYIKTHLETAYDIFNSNQFNVSYDIAFDYLIELENKQHIQNSSLLQDIHNINSFLNTTRGCSIKTDIMKQNRFDEDFSYIEGKMLGRGWEDVELGIRLYKQGYSFTGNPDIFVVHISHNPSGVLSSHINFYNNAVINFIKLGKKHNLWEICPVWTIDTLKKILKECKIEYIQKVLTT